uniref:dolichyl-diphosphooligosaccharide--protein glycotransferase n=1 Tax=Chromera velia CCMP2878 TaxID=1169474 RepID=A0A0G4FBQ2_9ALVE|eukprot:Cvel_16233.t1-p1 / transcript=Cvel_16233.t1 / gene=Cvel_16233 / organism=Chromera_velia_CCMP2878 / gene_product=Dolichyl-diphosphooligosaccharide--protein, putative / transcript_product=Dolichyl-diphosphooligosaccharide--protein, putative / location=Cvel_scaffold1241:31672-42957(-) / protein_length=737 / sequence_SO=supercontig / SO=protein_coding / is_pseudo=false
MEAKFLDSAVGIFVENSLMRGVQKTARRWAPVLEYSILFLICLLSFGIRLFAVIRFESVIHEFDPYFNYRTTQFLSKEGFYEFWNWFDDESWYPLGRVVGQTLYPGLMTTSAILFNTLRYCGFVIDIRDICVFLAPLFSGLAALAGYLMAREVSGRPEAGLFAAVFVGIVPSYLSRSVAGSYDNEGVAIFALVFAFYTFVRAVHSGTILSAAIASLAYFYMVSAWGGYVFIINVVSIYILALVVLGRLTLRHYVVYTVYYVLGTLLCLNIPFVHFAAIHSSEHMASHGMFVLVNAVVLREYLQKLVPRETLNRLLMAALFAVIVAFLTLFAFLSVTGRTRWSGRSMTLLDPSYAAKHVPIIASVSEHQPTTWSAYILDLHILVFLAPVGMWLCFKEKTDGSLFAGLYGVLAVYFSAVMIRLMLVVAPAMAVLGGIGLSYALSALCSYLRSPSMADRWVVDRRRESDAGAGGTGGGGKGKGGPETKRLNRALVLVMIGVLLFYAIQYIVHATWTSSVAYSHPSIVLASRMRDGTRVIQDDFREGYYWLRKNTAPKSRVMSWWDYGYQLTAMSNRTVLVDNNTWNNSHIATVGLAFASTEDDAYPILLKLDVDYVLVIFGGVARYNSDDINKFLWMIRIASGVFPRIQEKDYYNQRGQYSIGKNGAPALLNSLMYKCSYYRAGEMTRGFDYTRNEEIGIKDIKFKHLEEAYTTTNWIVRIYKVKKPSNRGPGLKKTGIQ